jgi:signal transduction histidine kinase
MDESASGDATTEGDETTEKLRQLHSVMREMMAAETNQDLFRTVTQAATELLDFEYNTIRRYDTENELLVPVAVSAPLRTDDGTRASYERGETVQWHAIDDQEILVFQNVGNIDDDTERSGDGSMLIVPIAEFGVLTMGTPESNSIAESDVELARVFGANIETAVDRVERIETLNESERELTQRAQQISVLNRGLRHNIRNELNLLMGWLSHLEGELTDENEDLVEQSLEAAKKIDSLAKQARNIQEMLADDHGPTENDLASIARAQIEHAQADYPVVSVETTIPESAPVRASDRIREALWQGIENAIVHNDSDNPRVAVHVEHLDDDTYTWQLTIADNGPGVPRQEQRVLSTAHEDKLQHGSGLGLWYMKWIVDRSDGELSFEDSEFETGTALKMRFRSPSDTPS